MDDRQDWSGEPDGPERGPPAPWEEEDYGADAPDPTRARHDAFTPGRRRIFLKHLARTGCIADAARLTGVSARTVYNHQENDREFARHCALAIEMAGGGIEQIAYERAVAGVPEQFACGGKVYTRTRYSDGLLRLLLQGANPGKYGTRPGFTRKRLRKWEREEIEKAVRAEIRAKQEPREEILARALRKIEAVVEHDGQEKLAAGWTKSDEGHLIPPGWIRDPAWVPAPRPEGEGDGTPLDSV